MISFTVKPFLVCSVLIPIFSQILTAEEKRLLKTFSTDSRTKREDTVLKQFTDLISSKKSKG
jgi:hypothetical protein